MAALAGNRRLPFPKPCPEKKAPDPPGAPGSPPRPSARACGSVNEAVWAEPVPAVRALGRQPGPPSWWLRGATGAERRPGTLRSLSLCPQRACLANWGSPEAAASLRARPPGFSRSSAQPFLRCPLARCGLGSAALQQPPPHSSLAAASEDTFLVTSVHCHARSAHSS